jgi:hypothetical protein
MTIKKCSRPEEHEPHRVVEDVCPGEPPTEVKHLEERGRHGVGLSDYLPGNVCHLVAPLVGHIDYYLGENKANFKIDDEYLRHMLDRLRTVLLLARDQIEKDEND